MATQLPLDPLASVLDICRKWLRYREARLRKRGYTRASTASEYREATDDERWLSFCGFLQLITGVANGVNDIRLTGGAELIAQVADIDIG
jgi:hypothetical protein